MLAAQNSRTMSNQRFVMSEQKERKMDLNEIFNVMDKLGDRFDDQVIFHTLLLVVAAFL